MRIRAPLLLALPVALLAGCSAKDAEIQTPYYYHATPTNRSSVNSWELNREPFYTQPGVDGGKPVTLKPIPSQRGFEPYDPLAAAVWYALEADGTIDTRYLSPRAKDGVVLLIGTTDNAAQKAKIEDIARRVPGVKKVVSELTIAGLPQKST